MLSLFCGEVVEFAENREFTQGYNDTRKASREVMADLAKTARETPIGLDKPRCATDNYWHGVERCCEHNGL